MRRCPRGARPSLLEDRSRELDRRSSYLGPSVLSARWKGRGATRLGRRARREPRREAARGLRASREVLSPWRGGFRDEAGGNRSFWTDPPRDSRRPSASSTDPVALRSGAPSKEKGSPTEEGGPLCSWRGRPRVFVTFFRPIAR
jgi:hypothetical protein